jgi:hypothetical protein
MWTICFPRKPSPDTFHVTRKQVCITIPELVRWEPELGPGPEPWIRHLAIDRDSARHLQALATIDRVAAELPAEMSRGFLQLVDTQMQAFDKKLADAGELSRHNNGCA